MFRKILIYQREAVRQVRPGCRKEKSGSRSETALAGADIRNDKEENRWINFFC